MDAISLTKEFYDFQIFVTSEADDLPEMSGQNHKKLLLVVEREDYTDETKTLLTKIIQAVGFDLAEDALLLQLDSDRAISIPQVRSLHEIDSLICFGMPLSRLGIHLQIPTYQITASALGQLLLADSLQHITQQKSAKAALWKALQAMFPKTV